MKLSYGAAWDDLTALARTHAPLIVALAGAFIFLPMLLVGYLLPQPLVKDAAEWLPSIQQYYWTNWPWLILGNLAKMTGSLAILILIFAPRGTSVGGAIVRALTFLPFYFLAALLMGLALGFASLFLVIPAFYLFGRLAPLPPVIVAEGRRNPIDAFGRTFEVTRGNGWRILGFFLLVAIGGFVAAGVASLVAGILFVLVAGKEVGTLLAMIVASAAWSAVAVTFLLLYAAVYRQLAGDPASVAEVFD
jgi:hypothetical protein